MNAGPSGFHNAPVTKLLLISSALFSLLLGQQDGGKAISVSYQSVFVLHQFWRLLLAPLCFSSLPEAIFGLWLLYFFRVFERQLGSNKFAVFVLFSASTSTALQLLSLVLLQRFTSTSALSLSPGPYGLLFACFLLFFLNIPPTTRLSLFGAPLTNKSLVYLAGAQLLLSSGLSSLLPSLAGLIAGCLHQANLLGIQKAKFPEAAAAAASHLVAPLLSRPPSSSSAASRVVSTNQGTPQVQTRLASLAPPLAPPGPPPEEAVSSLLAMGFEREAVVRALSLAGNDVTIASNLLLEAHNL